MTASRAVRFSRRCSRVSAADFVREALRGVGIETRNVAKRRTQRQRSAARARGAARTVRDRPRRRKFSAEAAHLPETRTTSFTRLGFAPVHGTRAHTRSWNANALDSYSHVQENCYARRPVGDGALRARIPRAASRMF